ncbi:MAG: LysR family transcriptional regulator [Burkholderiales bacterium]|nr:LysR family transcriptional regulator [Burkholderiales bacterium]
MELRHLRYFVTVAEELHFTRAAERLHIGQPPLSQQIQALEAELGVTLLERTRRQVKLTEAGKHFLARAKQILAAAQTARDEAVRVAQGEAGELRIAFTSSLPLTHFMPSALRAYRLAYPDVRLILAEMFTVRQFDALLEDRLDIGFVRYSGSTPPEGISLHEIRRDPLILFVNQHHRLAKATSVGIADLRHEDFVAYPRSVGPGLVEQLYHLCGAEGFTPRVVQEVSEATTQIGLVAAGLGLAILPSPLECVRVDGVRHIPIRDEGAHLSLGIAVAQARRSPQIEKFLAVVQAIEHAESASPQS